MSVTFNLNKTKIITRALQKINAIGIKDTPPSAEFELASDLLNGMFKYYEAQGLNLWKRRIGYLFLDYNEPSYDLGSSGDHATLSYIKTTLSSDAAAAATSLTVDSITGIADNDYIGIELDDGSRQWTQVNGTPSGSTINIDAALTDTASEDNLVVVYTTKISRPLRVLYGTVKDLTSGNETQFNLLNHDEYFCLPNKTTLGVPNQVYYDKLLTGSSPYTGKMYVWQNPNNVKYVIVFTFQEAISDILNNSDYADFPQEWILPIIHLLAYELGPYYEKSDAQMTDLKNKAMESLQVVQQFDSDDAPLQFGFE